LLKNTRIVVSVMAIFALVLGRLIHRGFFVPAKNTSNALNLYPVARRTVTGSQPTLRFVPAWSQARPRL
jgi:hypothetical protein